MDKIIGKFIWNLAKEQENIHKHGVDFTLSLKVFADTKRKVYIDSKHTSKEERLFCVGQVNGKILTVRFTYRQDRIRIFGAGYWRKGRSYYEKQKD